MKDDDLNILGEKDVAPVGMYAYRFLKTIRIVNFKTVSVLLCALKQ